MQITSTEKNEHNGKNNDNVYEKKQQQTMSTRTRNDNDSEGDIKTTLWRTIVSPRKMCAQTQAPSTE